MIRLSLRYIQFTLCLFTFLNLSAQESATLLEADYFLPNGQEFNSDELFGIALGQYENETLSNSSILGLATSSFALDESRSIDLMLESISRSTDQRKNNNLYVSIGDKYFRQNNYKESRKYYLSLDNKLLSDAQAEELNFRLAYTYLLEKNFTEAEGYFSKSSKFRGTYAMDNKYYLGICQYFLNKQDKAIENFKAVDSYSKYKGQVPYYLAQIYFKNEDYDKVIQYAEPKLREASLKNKTEIQKILGLSYLNKENYEKALMFLDAYATESPKLTENEFYQIGMAHYNLQQYDKAILFFSELSHQDSEIGQVSNYLSASIFLSADEKKKAQAAYKQASKYDFYPDIKQESNFLYYKLSADMGEERIAVNGLSEIPPDNKYYDESQDLLSKVLLRSKDYSASLKAIENLPAKSDPILLSYKNISYDYGLQQLEESKIPEAIKYLEISRQTPGEAGDISRKVNFWLGHAYDDVSEKKQSQEHLELYLNSGDKEYNFDAHYIIAFQDIESKNYDKAKKHLEDALENFDDKITDKALANDAIVRLADIELLNNNYENAIQYYDLAIGNEAAESDYILYQKALIYGVNNQFLNKLTSLEKLLKEYPESKYRDDALFEIGESLLALNKNNDAVKIYQSVHAQYGNNSPYSATSYLRLGLISYNQGDLKSAIEYYKKGIVLGADKDEERQAMLAIEEIYVRDLNDPQSYFEFAEMQGKQIKDISKDSISYSVAFTAYKDGKYYDAIKLFNNYIVSYTTGYYLEDALYYTAESAVLVKDYDVALKNYEEIIRTEKQKHYISAVEKAALISYNHNQDFIKSFDLYEILIDNDSLQNLNIYEATLFSAYKIQNEEGIIKYGTYIVNHADATPELRSSSYYYIAKSYERQNASEQAIQSYRNVIPLTESNKAAEASFRIAQMLFNNQDFDASETQAFETTKIAAKYPFWVAKSLILLGDIYTAKKDYLNASAAYESVIENFKDSNTIIKEAQEKLDALNKLIDSSSRIKEVESLELIQNDSIK